MVILKIIFWTLITWHLSGCQIGYLLKSAKGQISLLSQRVSIDEAILNPHLSDEIKSKLRLAQEVKSFAENEMSLAKTGNYNQFVLLDRPHVSYVLSAAPPWRLSAHLWKFPIIGNVPYKGYFNEADAKEEAKELEKNFDVYLRGVNAFSTLGWFNDPIVSSMTQMKEHDFSNIIIHETVHATLYIKNSADFNERLATFLGNLGVEKFYLKKEGPHSPTVKIINHENHDEKIFSQFISQEIELLEKWYLEVSKKDESLRQARLKEIQTRFQKDILPQMKTNIFKFFSEITLNNARLVMFKTYNKDLSQFAQLYERSEQNFQRFIDQCRQFEKSKDPEKALSEFLAI